jgi:hypothetical protein
VVTSGEPQRANCMSDPIKHSERCDVGAWKRTDEGELRYVYFSLSTLGFSICGMSNII